MPPPQDHDDFGFRELRNPLHRAHDLENWYDHLSVWDQFKEENRLEYQDLRGILRGGKDPSTFPLGRMTRAIHLSLDEAMTMMGGESLNMGHALLAGIVPMLADLVEYVGGFALLGAGVGLLGGPFDEVTVPGGAATGAEFGLWLFGRVGLAKILYESATHLDRFTALAKDATELAVYAGEDRAVKVESDIHYAAKLYAAAIAELWWVILQALILYLLKRTAEIAGKVAGNAATSAMKTEAYQKALAEVRKSTTKFGTGFNDWFDNNIERIQQALEKREKELEQARKGDSASNLEASAAARRAQSYKDIDAYQKKYEALRDEAREDGNNRRAGGYQAKVTEAVGERETTKYIEQNDPNLQMQQGFSPGTGADQVYASYDAEGNVTEYVVVEAKGPGATLSQDAAKGPQMSQQWMNNTIKEMMKSSDPNTRALGQSLQDAMDDGEPPITGKVIQALPGGGAQELPSPVSIYNPPQ